MKKGYQYDSQIIALVAYKASSMLRIKWYKYLFQVSSSE